MLEVVGVDEMRAIDEEARRETPVEELVERAGAAVYRAVIAELRRSPGRSEGRPGGRGFPYGKRAIVIAGKGHNGDDGRVAAARLRSRGMKVEVLDAARAPARLVDVDIVIDAAYGTGFRGSYDAPEIPPGALAIAVDIPSGLDADTGECAGAPMGADRTVSFAALKPGLLLGEGLLHAGSITVADIGLDVSRASVRVIEDSDLELLLPQRAFDAHKWRSGVAIVAGSEGMMGSAVLCSNAAARSGAGMVRLGVPGCSAAGLPVSEVVSRAIPGSSWSDAAVSIAERCKALVVGPGLGRGGPEGESVRRVLAASPIPVVLDGDGLWALGEGHDALAACAASRSALVLTPHDGELRRLIGSTPGPDRIGCARQVAASTGAVALLKGPCTVIADPGGEVLLAVSGSARLATAGSGDVLSGIIAAFIARGVEPFLAAALGAHVHGRAASLGLADGLVAGDLGELVARWLSEKATGAPGSLERSPVSR